MGKYSKQQTIGAAAVRTSGRDMAEIREAGKLGAGARKLENDDLEDRTN